MMNERTTTTNSDADSHIDTTQQEDLTGRDRLVSNLFWSWGSYGLVFVIGFIMPRLIDRRLGQVELGIWDFAWSLVSYLSYSNLGIGSSVNRYVAKFRAASDISGLRSSVSSVLMVQLVISLFVLVGAIIISLMIPAIFSQKLGTHLADSQWVVMLLGLSIAVEQGLNAFRGVISGCHRWDLHNGLNLFSRLLAFAGMFIVVLMGMGLKALALAYLCAIVLAELTRVYIAYEVCRELKIRPSYVSCSRAKEMVFFGGKTVLASLSRLVVIQTIGVIVTGIMGPAIMAVLSRSITLVRHMSTFVDRFSFITTPTAGALQATGNERELRDFLLDSSRFGVAITLPMVFFFVLQGKALLTIWMGSHYVSGNTLELLALGYLLPVSQSPALRILVGLNKHGKIGLICFLTALTVLGVGIGILSYAGWSLPRVALLIGISLTLSNGIIMPIYVCRVMNIPIFTYIWSSFSVPFLCNIPLIATLLLSQAFFMDSLLMTILVGLTIGGTITALLYFFFILPDKYREKALRVFYRRSGPAVKKTGLRRA